MTRSVILVDDAEDLRTLVSLAIRRDGRLSVIASVGDGEQGVAAVEDHRPDAVLMDLSMPKMDGLAATRALKERHPDLPILIFTGYGDERLRSEAERAGADAFADKSQPLDEVIDLLFGLASGKVPTAPGD